MYLSNAITHTYLVYTYRYSYFLYNSYELDITNMCFHDLAITWLLYFLLSFLSFPSFPSLLLYYPCIYNAITYTKFIKRHSSILQLFCVSLNANKGVEILGKCVVLLPLYGLTYKKIIYCCYSYTLLRYKIVVLPGITLI